jgi:2-polyprenyl-3-methyl-5-hydroxy-6-metoxy-1,4-benzoquinol methylase
MDLIDYHKTKESKENFWYDARRSLIIDILRKNRITSSNILEVGCGIGSQLPALASFNNRATGCDINGDSLEVARRNRLKVFFLDLEKNSTDTKYDVVCGFDVLEHIPDDRSALKNIHDSLDGNGIFIFSVPAYNFLFSGHDKALRHKRRYGRTEIIKKITDAGFELREIFYWNSFLFPAVAVQRLLNKGGRGSNINSYKLFDRILFRVLWLENYLIRIGLRIPFGLSIFGIAKKI